MFTLIIDLDNTIYSVDSIEDNVFPPLYAILEKKEYEINPEELDVIKKDIKRIPFQKVAAKYHFPVKLIEEATGYLRELTYEDEMEYFEDYEMIRTMPLRRFLLTSGFYKLQLSKVKKLGIEHDFDEIFIVDVEKNEETKQDVIEKIIAKYAIKKEDLLIIGDDPESEINAANNLGIKSFLLDKADKFGSAVATYKGKSLSEIQTIPEIKKLLQKSSIL